MALSFVGCLLGLLLASLAVVGAAVGVSGSDLHSLELELKEELGLEELLMMACCFDQDQKMKKERAMKVNKNLQCSSFVPEKS